MFQSGYLDLSFKSLPVLLNENVKTMLPKLFPPLGSYATAPKLNNLSGNGKKLCVNSTGPTTEWEE